MAGPHHPDAGGSVPPGGRFDFDDGGTYCGGWEDGKAHGHGVCTGPKSQGEYSGSWHFGFEVSGVYTWPSGSTYEGQWQNGKRHGLGVETRGRWTYRGEWTQGFKGRYGVRQSVSSGAKYEGTWANGLQDGYGSETYADGGTYQGQWMRGMRHGYGTRTSASFGLASHYRPKSRGSLASLPTGDQAADPAADRDRKIDDFRGGFVLKSRSDEPPARRRSLVEKSTHLKKSILQGLKIKKQRSTGDIDRRGASSVRSSGSNLSSASSESGHSALLPASSAHTDSNVSFVSQDELCDAQVTETYTGEWKNDRRCGFGIAERSDGLRYEGEWYNNKKYGYGVTTMKDGTREEGKYKNNVLVSSGKKKHLFVLRSAKFKERIDAAVNASMRGSQIALQKADIAISRTATARGKAEQADIGAIHAQEDSNIARHIAKQFDPDVKIPGPDVMKQKFGERINPNRTPFANLSNQSLAPKSQESLRTDSPLGSSRQNLSTRGMSMGTPQPQPRYMSSPIPTIVQQQTVNRTDPYASQNDPKKFMTNQIPVSQPQYPSQATVTLNQPSYANAQPVVTIMHQQQQDARYPAQQESRYPGGLQQDSRYPGGLQQDSRYPGGPQQDSRYPGASQQDSRYPGGPQQDSRYPGGPQPDPRYQSSHQQVPMPYQQQQQQQQARYAPQDQGYGAYPQQQSSQQQYQKVNSNYLGAPDVGGGLDPPVVPNRTGSFRRRTSAREGGGYTMQQAMGDHFDHYRQEPRPRTVIKHGRRIPSPPRGGSREMTPLGGLYGTSPQYQPRTSYGPDATPDSGVSESMDGDELSPARYARKSQLPPLIYGDSHASSLLSFAPSEDSRTMSPTMSSMGIDSEVGSEASTGSNAFARTASLYVNPPSRRKAGAVPQGGPVGGGGEGIHKRKKSMPHGPKDIGGAQPKVIPREEVAFLSSQRREEVRRMQYEAERLRSNPLLYLVRPDLKDWFSRQQLIMLVLFINISLAVMFFKLLS